MSQEHRVKRYHEYQYVEGRYKGPTEEETEWCKRCTHGQKFEQLTMCGYALEKGNSSRQLKHGLPLNFGAYCEEYNPKKKYINDPVYGVNRNRGVIDEPRS